MMEDKNLNTDQSLELIQQMICAGRYISETVIRNKYMIYASAFLLPIGLGIIRQSWINADPDGNLILFAAAILIGVAGSGHALKRQVKRDAAASENEN